MYTFINFKNNENIEKIEKNNFLIIEKYRKKNAFESEFSETCENELKKQ